SLRCILLNCCPVLFGKHRAAECRSRKPARCFAGPTFTARQAELMPEGVGNASRPRACHRAADASSTARRSRQKTGSSIVGQAELRNEELILSHEYHPYMAQASLDDEDCCGFSPNLIGRGMAPLRATAKPCVVDGRGRRCSPRICAFDNRIGFIPMTLSPAI